jgi:hypothetical protein
LNRKGVSEHIRLENIRQNQRRSITAITTERSIAETALRFKDIIIIAARAVGQGIIDIQQNETWIRFNIHGVSLNRYIWKRTEGLDKIREEFTAENVGLVISMKVQWFGNPTRIRERYRNREITASSMAFAIERQLDAHRILNSRIRAAGIRYEVEKYVIPGPDCMCRICCERGYIENKCPKPDPPQFMFCQGKHPTENHICNVVDCKV